MTMFDMVIGESPAANQLLEALGITKWKVARYRSCWLEEGRICLHTRTGGGNREFFESEESRGTAYAREFDVDPNNVTRDFECYYHTDLRAIEGFIEDSDDDYDSTYANFYYEIPKALEPHLGSIEIEKPASEKWRAAMELIKRTEL
jgi:hypothetical protein